MALRKCRQWEPAEELVRRNLDALNRRDINGYIATVATDFVLHSQFAGVEGRAYHGHGDIPGYFEDLADAWHGYRAEPRDMVQGKKDKVACQLLVNAQAERSGIQVTKRIGAVFSLRAGKIVAIDTYPTRAEAVEAAGPSGQDVRSGRPSSAFPVTRTVWDA